MEHKERLRMQLKEAYGRITYSFTAHNKDVDILLWRKNCVNWMQIVLSAIATGGIIKVLIKADDIFPVVTAGVSTLLLILNILIKNWNVENDIKEHKNSAESLWLIKEKYTSLLTDMEELETEEICKRRDALMVELSEVYSNTPKTSRKAYERAQKALKIEEEQYFSDGELDSLLPMNIRDKINKEV